MDKIDQSRAQADFLFSTTPRGQTQVPHLVRTVDEEKIYAFSNTESLEYICNFQTVHSPGARGQFFIRNTGDVTGVVKLLAVNNGTTTKIVFDVLTLSKNRPNEFSLFSHTQVLCVMLHPLHPA